MIVSLLKASATRVQGRRPRRPDGMPATARRTGRIRTADVPLDPLSRSTSRRSEAPSGRTSDEARGVFPRSGLILGPKLNGAPAARLPAGGPSGVGVPPESSDSRFNRCEALRPVHELDLAALRMAD